MKIMVRTALAAFIGLALASAASAQEAQAQFAVGQVWSIRNLTNARATIGRIEPYGGDTAIHISISSDTPARFAPYVGHRSELAHAPISAEAFARSVVALEATGASPAPAFEDGYAQWRAASDGGNAGIFTIEVAQIVDAMAEMISGSSPSRK